MRNRDLWYQVFQIGKKIRERKKILLELRVLTKKTENKTNQDRIFFFNFITKEQSKFFNVDVYVVMKTVGFKSQKEKIKLGVCCGRKIVGI